MIKIASPNLHSQDKIPDEINKSADMLMSIARSIKETAQSGIYSGVQDSLEMAVRELQYLDRMIEEHYGDRIPNKIPNPTLHERATPDTNYLLRPEFHSG